MPNPHTVTIRVDPDELQRWKATARQDSRTLSNFIRFVLGKACGRPNIESEQPGAGKVPIWNKNAS